MLFYQGMHNTSQAGLSPVLYHYTGIHNALSILDREYFILSPALGSKADYVPNQKLYFFSTSRIKFGGYARSNLGKSGVTFVLDGSKLAQRYSGSPVDYWGESWRSVILKGGGRPEEVLENYLGKDENEDRVFSDNSVIPVSPYVSEAHFYFDMKEDDSNYNNYHSKIRKALIKCHNLGIDCYLYNDRSAFMNLTKSRAIDITELPKVNFEPEEPFKGKYNTDMRSDHMDGYLELYHAKKATDLSKRADKLAHDIIWYTEDKVRSLEADIHNSRHGNEFKKKEVHKLLALFKKEGVNTIREFIEILKEKAKALFPA